MIPGAFGRIRARELCESTGKVRWLGRSGAERERDTMARHEGRGSRLEVYYHGECDAWHVGHAVRKGR